MPTTEVVIYQIKQEKMGEFAKISPIVDSFAKKRKGFKSRSVKQDHQDPSLFLDIVEWETLEDAVEANEASQKDPTLVPFMEAIEKIVHFNHFHNYER